MTGAVCCAGTVHAGDAHLPLSSSVRPEFAWCTCQPKAKCSTRKGSLRHQTPPRRLHFRSPRRASRSRPASFGAPSSELAPWPPRPWALRTTADRLSPALDGTLLLCTFWTSLDAPAPELSALRGKDCVWYRASMAARVASFIDGRGDGAAPRGATSRLGADGRSSPPLCSDIAGATRLAPFSIEASGHASPGGVEVCDSVVTVKKADV